MTATATSSAFERVLSAYPTLEGLPPNLREEVERNLSVMQVPAGTPMFHEKDACSAFPIILSGRVRIARTMENGRELVLYEVEPGESCVLSTSCLLGNARYNAHAQCVTDVELASLPRAVFDRLVSEHRPFREEVFHLFGERLVRLVELVESIGFQRLDQRLAAALLGKGQRLTTSHEQLAHTLAVSRESISRMLKQFEEHGWVKLGRGAIEILQPRELRTVATGPSVGVPANDTAY
jgi:CRP/FNR family transcriptional regulator, anaerobic regulatory protein